MKKEIVKPFLKDRRVGASKGNMSLLKRFFHGTNPKTAISWAFFDFANSAYSLMIMTFVFPIFFREVIAGGKYGDFWWGFVVSISILAGAIASPLIGAMADHDAQRKKKFMLFSLLAMLGTILLFYTGSDMLLIGALTFIAANFFFEVAVVLYDSFLVKVSSRKTAGRISGLGWGLGYIGGLVAMLLFRPLYGGGFDTAAAENLYKITFPLTGLFFLLFSVPSFIYLKDDRKANGRTGFLTLMKIGFSNVFSTLKDIKKHKDVAWFLLAFYFINDALVTLFAFVPIYARTTLSFSIAEITVILLIIQLIGFPAAIFFGWLSDRKGSKRILLSTIIIWAVIVLIGAVSVNKAMFYIVAVLAGCVIGSSQAIARSWLSRIIPAKKRCEFFGFNGFASKIAATTGPVVFGTVSSLTGSQRWAMIALLPFFIVSFIIFARIKEQTD